MTTDAQLETFKVLLAPIARAAAYHVRVYGWTADDCEQEAAAWWFGEGKDGGALSDEGESKKYLTVMIKRYLVRKARGHHLTEKLEFCGRMFATGKTTYEAKEPALVDVVDTIEAAPGDVAEWLGVKVILGMNSGEATAALGWPRRKAERVQEEAEDWFLTRMGVRP